MAHLAKRLCAEDVSQESVQPYTACRLVPLDKNPGVRLRGICEVICRIIGKAVLGVIGDNIRLNRVGLKRPFTLCGKFTRTMIRRQC